MKYKWITDPNKRGIYNNGDLELKCPFCGYEWEYDEDTTHKEFSECPKCLSDMTWSKDYESGTG